VADLRESRDGGSIEEIMPPPSVIV